MNKEQYYQKLKNIIGPYLPEDVSLEDIQMDSHLVNELNINSANLVDIILDVEDEFDIVLENEDMDAMQTVRDAMELISKKRISG
jgi:acyl carrier protein